MEEKDIVNEPSETENENENENEAAAQDVQEEPCGKEECRDQKEKKKSKAKTALLEKEIEALQAKLSESEDKYLRLAAEYENFRKRSKAEREGIYTEAAADAVKELLPIFDNLHRATEYTAPDKVAEGVELILKGLPDVFSKMKICAYGAVGEQFDPNIHNAVMHIEDSAYGENEIIDVFQQGYMLGDKVIRYAMVRVAN